MWWLVSHTRNRDRSRSGQRPRQRGRSIPFISITKPETCAGTSVTRMTPNAGPIFQFQCLSSGEWKSLGNVGTCFAERTYSSRALDSQVGFRVPKLSPNLTRKSSNLTPPFIGSLFLTSTSTGALAELRKGRDFVDHKHSNTAP